jgi:hypothetical protein
LYRRCKGNLTRALNIATREAPTEAQIARYQALGVAARQRAENGNLKKKVKQ